MQRRLVFVVRKTVVAWNEFLPRGCNAAVVREQEPVVQAVLDGAA